MQPRSLGALALDDIHNTRDDSGRITGYVLGFATGEGAFTRVTVETNDRGLVDGLHFMHRYELLLAPVGSRTHYWLDALIAAAACARDNKPLPPAPLRQDGRSLAIARQCYEAHRAYCGAASHAAGPPFDLLDPPEAIRQVRLVEWGLAHLDAAPLEWFEYAITLGGHAIAKPSWDALSPSARMFYHLAVAITAAAQAC